MYAYTNFTASPDTPYTLYIIVFHALSILLHSDFDKLTATMSYSSIGLQKVPNTRPIRATMCIGDVDSTCFRHQEPLSLESFHMKCRRHILGILWYDRIRNTEIAVRTGLPPLMDLT